MPLTPDERFGRYGGKGGCLYTYIKLCILNYRNSV